MINRFVNTIVFVKDLEKSKLFYTEVLQMKVKKDYGTIVFFENQLVLHDVNSILETIFKEKYVKTQNEQGKSNVLIYFETNKLDEFYNDIKDKVSIIHGIEKQQWGQKVFRFYDPDNHMVEFGEPFRVEELIEKIM
jgi:catechol 2,3-dioxygenase-like lactoylglutathione lyase family enzyme